MKSRIMMSVLVIALAAALIAGATAAWFTAETDLPTAEFKAGTVIISADDGPTYATAEGKSFENVNPGDCGRVTWEIINEGTKKIELRVKLSELWIVGEEEGALSTDNFFYAPVPGSDWVMYEEDGEIWLYYTGGPVKGTFNPDGEPFEPVSVELSLIVAFDGPSTGNEYQGREFELNGLVEAVQASNGAPNAVWGEAWEGVTAEGYEPDGLAGEYLAYIMETPCWNGGQPDPEKYTVSAIIVEEGNGSVSGTGSFDVGAAVQLIASPAEGYQFVGWEDTEGLTDASINGAALAFTMPEQDVTVTAVFEEIPDPSRATRIEIYGPTSIIIPSCGSVTKQYTAKVFDQYNQEMSGQTIVWSENKKHVEIDQNGLLTVYWNASRGNFTITATVEDVSGNYTVNLRYWLFLNEGDGCSEPECTELE